MTHQDGNKEALGTVLNDKLSHYVDYKKGHKYNDKRQRLATVDGNDADYQMISDSRNQSQDPSFEEKLAQYDFSHANAEVAKIEGLEKRVLIAPKD